MFSLVNASNMFSFTNASRCASYVSILKIFGCFDQFNKKFAPYSQVHVAYNMTIFIFDFYDTWLYYKGVQFEWKFVNILPFAIYSLVKFVILYLFPSLFCKDQNRGQISFYKKKGGNDGI